MAKYVKFEGKTIGINGRKFSIIDSSGNVKKAAKHYQNLLKKIDEENDTIAGFVSQSPLLADEIAETIADIAGLSEKEKKGLENQSFSDQYEIFNEFLIKFLGIQMPTLDDNEEAETEEKPDPKLQEED